MTSTYAFESLADSDAVRAHEREGYLYGREANPTQALLEQRLASLEGAEAGLALASGIGAISSLVWTLVSAGEEIVIDHTIYGSSFAFFTKGLSRFGITTRLADLTRPETLQPLLNDKTRLVFFETPANPNLRVIDIARIAGIAHEAGATVAVDNTFASPVLQRPLEHGADVIVHSATKYLGGHGDLLGGIAVGKAQLVERIRGIGLRWMTGATISPLNAFLILRGLKTLEIRMARHSASAMSVAELLAGHKAVSQLFYPGLRSFPQYELAKRQMSAPGGLIACELAGGIQAGLAFMNRLKLVTRAVSLGDAETLIQHPATMTHAAYSPEERAAHGIRDGLLRFSIGLENVDDILDDIQQALDAV
jgi:methionine-gamma-lyase